MKKVERYAGQTKKEILDWFKKHNAPVPTAGSGMKGNVLVRDLEKARMEWLEKNQGGDESLTLPDAFRRSSDETRKSVGQPPMTDEQARQFAAQMVETSQQDLERAFALREEWDSKGWSTPGKEIGTPPLSRDEVRQVARFRTKQWRESRGGVAYVYYSIYAELQDGQMRNVGTEIGPYKAKVFSMQPVGGGKSYTKVFDGDQEEQQSAVNAAKEEAAETVWALTQAVLRQRRKSAMAAEKSATRQGKFLAKPTAQVKVRDLLKQLRVKTDIEFGRPDYSVFGNEVRDGTLIAVIGFKTLRHRADPESLRQHWILPASGSVKILMNLGRDRVLRFTAVLLFPEPTPVPIGLGHDAREEKFFALPWPELLAKVVTRMEQEHRFLRTIRLDAKTGRYRIGRDNI